MDLLNLVLILIFIVVGFVIARIDKSTGKIPNKYTHPLIFLGVIASLIRYGFSIEFYKFFTILILLYFVFECIQRVLDINNNNIGTGDVKFFLAFYCLFPFSANAYYGLPLVNIFGFVCIGISMMVLFKILYFSLLNRLPKVQLLIGSTMDRTSIRLAPLIYISSLVFFLFF